MKKRLFISIFYLVISSPLLFAQENTEEIERKIEVLAEEIERIKIGEALVTADKSQLGFGPAASKIYRTERGVSIGGYGEVVYFNYASEKDDGSEGGKIDMSDALRAIIYVGYKFNSKWLLNTEFEFEHGSSGASGSVSAEFVHLEYTHSPAFNMRFGLLLLPVGLVNEMHEPTVYIGANRPDVEKYIMPSTWRENGFGIYGNTKLLSYRAYIVNGLKGAKFASKGLRGGRQKGSKALTEHFALTGRVDFTPRPGLILGGSFYAGNSGNGLLNGSKKLGVSTNILEGHIDIRRSGFWISLLAAQAKIGDVTGLNQALGLTGNKSVGETLNGFYLQAGYDLLHRSGYGEKSLMPYMRYEKVNTQASVPSGYNLDPSKNMSSMTLGVAYSPEPRIVFKADYKNANNKAGTGLDQTSLQVGYVF
tara:strand:- start:152592 stop:153854 length:1263 start_codon:yes stop_codon:yes gene_type:complete